VGDPATNAPSFTRLDDRAVGTRLAVPPGVRVVDGKGQFLIPGLWDMHTHLQAVGDASLLLYIANGVTGIRDMGSDLDFILPLREKTISCAVPTSGA